MRIEQEGSWWGQAFMFLVSPRESWARLRFARTGTVEDYWRHEYYLKGSKGIADIIVTKDKLIGRYCDEAYRARRT